MKILKKILIIVLVLAALIAIIGYMLPKGVYLERSITINATPSSIFEEMNSLQSLDQWNPWSKIDPEMTQTFEGPDTGVGSKVSWQSNNTDVGDGSQEIVESIADEKVRVELYIGDLGPNYADLTLSTTEGGTLVTWAYEGDMGNNPFVRYVGLVLDGMLGSKYEEGLNNLKDLVESKPAFNADISTTEADAITYLAIRQTFDVTNPETIGPQMGLAYGKIGAHMGANNIEGAGMPMSVYISLDSISWVADIAIPVVGDNAEGAGDIIAGATTGGKVVIGIHMGDYNKLETTHSEIMQYIEFKGLEVVGNAYEIYVTNPGQVQDTAQWQTDVYYPVK